MSYTCVIIDDDPMARTILARMLKTEKRLELQAEFNHPVEMIDWLVTNKTDLIFLDIEMPEMSGMEFLRLLGNQHPPVILTTTHPGFALEAFRYDIIGYLVKPVQTGDFRTAIDKFVSLRSKLGNYQPESPEYYFFRKNDTIVRIEQEEISLIECIGDYATVHTPNERFILHGTMRTMETNFPPPHFIRVHRSYIVPVRKIEEIEDDAIAIGPKIIPIGRTYRPEVYKQLNIL